MKTIQKELLKKLKEAVKKLNMGGIIGKVKDTEIPKIEKLNNVSINLYCYEDNHIIPLYISKYTKVKFDVFKMKNENATFSDFQNKVKYQCIDLLMLSDGDNFHYVLIKDFNKLCYDTTKHRDRKHFCRCCIHHFSSEMSLNKHFEECMVI